MSIGLSYCGGTGTDPGGGGGGGLLLQGVLRWKGDASGSGSYSGETTLTPPAANPAQFGKLADIAVDGLIVAQPLFVESLDVAAKGKHNAVIVVSEHDSVYAFDADGSSSAPLWQKHYLDPANGITAAPDNFGGRTTLGGEIGITGTPVVEPSTGVMYFVTMIQRNGVSEQWLRAIDVHSGNDFGPGSVKISASVPGDGVASSNGQIAFDPGIQNQRAGLALAKGIVYIAWGSFSDFGRYHGWLMAYDSQTLSQVAVFNPTPQHQAIDFAFGPADFGGGGSFWMGGAAPAMDAAGNLYIVAADGSFNADQGGSNYGDTVLKLRLSGNAFQVVDWFTPSNQACIDEADLEIGSGGVAILPDATGAGRKLGAVINKEGRLYLLDLSNMGHYNPLGDTQIPQQFMVGADTCFANMGGGFAEGTNWNRMYGNVSYWNGNLYMAVSNGTLHQFAFSGGLLNPTPVAQSATVFGLRAGNTVVSANGAQSAILWAYDKSSNNSVAVLHAYDALNVGQELWNSGMKAGRDGMGAGIGFGTPVVANGRVFATYDRHLVIFGPLK